MIKFIKQNWKILFIFFAAFTIFYPSLFVFYTNDDFFFLKISQVDRLTGFLNFFSLAGGPEGFGMYRPLTTQVFYFLSHALFSLNPLGLHVISFLIFFGVIFMVYKLALLLLPSSETMKQSDNIAVVSAFLYAVSMTHFAHLYYLAAFQELGMTLFVLLSVYFFVKFLSAKRIILYLLSLISFLLALASKETAVVTPLLLGLVYFFLKSQGLKTVSIKKFFLLSSPFAICLFAYLFIRVYSYGFASGDTYIWDFSIAKFFNTLFWYLLWSFNLPETLLDFIGPGLKVNPNLWLYWSKEFLPIFILFALQTCAVVFMFLRFLFRQKLITIHYSLFTTLWFLTSLLPVVFLPAHKFTFYLTLPLVGIVFLLSRLFLNSRLLIFYCLIWSILSVLTIRHTVNTNWITQGQKISKTAYEFFASKGEKIEGKDIYFIDTTKDKQLPWSPTGVLETALSGNNFFAVFFPDLESRVSYLGREELPKMDNAYIISSRQFLGY